MVDSTSINDAFEIKERLATLRTEFRGEILLPEDDDYDVVRSVWNGMIDRRPSLILRCTGTADVVAGVNFAREVRPLSVCESGVQYDTSPWRREPRIPTTFHRSRRRGPPAQARRFPFWTGPRWYEHQSGTVCKHSYRPDRCPTMRTDNEGGGMTTADRNERLVREYFEGVWNEGDISVLDTETLSEEYVLHAQSNDQYTVEELRTAWSDWHRAFPDLSNEIQDLIATDDRVVIRYRFSCTHEAEIMGLPPDRQHGRNCGNRHLPAQGWPDNRRVGDGRRSGTPTATRREFVTHRLSSSQ